MDSIKTTFSDINFFNVVSIYSLVVIQFGKLLDIRLMLFQAFSIFDKSTRLHYLMIYLRKHVKVLVSSN